MAQPRRNALDVLKHLPRTNCRECGLPACLSFATAVVQGQRSLGDCPYVTPDALAAATPDLQEQHDRAAAAEAERQAMIAELSTQIAALDFASLAPRIGAELRGQNLGLRVLGKVFEIDPRGGLHADIHVNSWIHGPLLDHVLRGADARPAEDWVRFAELDGAQDWDRFFAHRCEGALRQLLEADADLFLGLLELFGAPPAPGSRAAGFPADHRLVLPLLPRVPWLICHTAADGDFEAAVTLLFDRTASRHLSGGALYQLVQGVIEMLRQIAARHSGPRL